MIDCESVENVLKAFEVRLKIADNNQRIGIVVDADVNLKSRWDSIVSILKKTGKYDIATIELPQDDLILEPTDTTYPKVGIWLMPDNNQNGMLEDFMTALAAPDDVLMKKSEDVLTSIIANDNKPSAIYDQTGRQFTMPTKEIYIKEGKKHIK